MATFPTKPILSQGESPSLYKNIPMDNMKGAKSDGGYEFRRRQFSRKPRRKIETGFIKMPHADYLVLDAFYEEHQLDVAFTWHDYIHDVSRQVRFDEFKPEYKGIGTNRKWTVKIKMSEI